MSSIRCTAFAVICLIAATGCSDRQSRKPPPNLLIATYANGRTTVDGQAVTPEMLRNIIESNPPSRRVSLYIERPALKPDAEIDEIIKQKLRAERSGQKLDPDVVKVIDQALLRRGWVFFYQKADFSDTPIQIGVPPNWSFGIENRTGGDLTNLSLVWPNHRLQLSSVPPSRYSPVVSRRVSATTQGFVSSPVVVVYTTSDSVQHSVTAAIPAAVSSAILDTNDMLLFVIRKAGKVEVRRK